MHEYNITTNLQHEIGEFKKQIIELKKAIEERASDTDNHTVNTVTLNGYLKSAWVKLNNLSDFVHWTRLAA